MRASPTKQQQPPPPTPTDDQPNEASNSMATIAPVSNKNHPIEGAKGYFYA